MIPRSFALALCSVREASRSHRTYAARGVVLALLLLAVIVTHEQMLWMNLGGVLLLQWTLWIDYILCTWFVISVFSGAITEEKERMTLGLLRLAGFSSGSILLGKSLGLLVQVLLLLVVQVPFGLLAVTFGGVSPDQLLASFALLGCHVAMGYGFALFCSASARTSSGAARMTAALLVLYHLAASVVPGWWETTVLVALVEQTSLRIAGSGGGEALWVVLVVNVAVGAILFGLAWARLGRFEEPPALVPARPRADAPRRSRSWRGDPLFHKDFASIGGGMRGVLLRVLTFGAMCLVFLVWFQWHSEVLLPLVPLALALDLAIQAGRVFDHEVKLRTLGALVILPRSPGSVLRAKFAGAVCGSLPVLFLYVFGEALFRPRFHPFAEPGYWFFVSLLVLWVALTASLSLRFGRAALFMAACIAVLAGASTTIMASFSRGGRVDTDPLFVVATGGCILASVLALRACVLSAQRRAAEE